MLTAEIRSQVDRIWDAFRCGGISNPLEVIEQITDLLFLRRLDELQTLEENRANRLGRPIEHAVSWPPNLPIGPRHDGRFDSLGLHNNGSPVLFEYQRSMNKNVIDQSPSTYRSSGRIS